MADFSRWHIICNMYDVEFFGRQIMTADHINVLINDASWAWPDAVRQIFRDRSVQLLVVKNADEALDTLQHRRIHTAIVDAGRQAGGLAIIKMIRSGFPLLPCILIADDAEQKLLSAALELDVFSVINKPVDIPLLKSQLHRLFLRRYGSTIFEN
ncbi:MAG: response regulator [Sedimentisphaerales bacterium]|nr:response regulator [Sedimentisphaerales bacterium]